MEETELAIPPGSNPLAAAMKSYLWGDEAYYLVPHDGQYYVWIKWPSGDHVFVAPSEEEASAFLDRQQAWFTFVTDYGDRLAQAEITEPHDGGVRLLYEAVLVDGAQAGILVAVRDETGKDQQYRLRRFDDLRAAGEEFAASAERFADRVQLDRLTDFPEIAAENLRYRAASARADTLRVLVGDAVRRDQERILAERELIPQVGQMVGVSREFLRRVLAGHEWARSTTPEARGAGRLKPPPTGAPATGWTVTAALTLDATDERDARAALNTVLAALDVSIRGEPPLVLVGGHDRFWFARVTLDLSELGTIDPDDALTHLRYVTRNVPGVTWQSDVRPGQREGRYEWPCGWATREQILVHPAIRAAEITAAKDHPSA